MPVLVLLAVSLWYRDVRGDGESETDFLARTLAESRLDVDNENMQALASNPLMMYLAANPEMRKRILDGVDPQTRALIADTSPRSKLQRDAMVDLIISGDRGRINSLADIAVAGAPAERREAAAAALRQRLNNFADAHLGDRTRSAALRDGLEAMRGNRLSRGGTRGDSGRFERPADRRQTVLQAQRAAQQAPRRRRAPEEARGTRRTAAERREARDIERSLPGGRRRRRRG